MTLCSFLCNAHHSVARRLSVRSLALLMALCTQACISNAGGLYRGTGGPVVSPGGSPVVSPGGSQIGGSLSGAATPIEQLPGWSNDDFTGIAVAIERQCELANQPRPWSRLCVEFRALVRSDSSTNSAHKLSALTLKHWVESRFQAWPVLGANQDDTGLITGYYEPILTGSRNRENDGQAPIYKRPPDLLRIDIPNPLDPAASTQASRMRGRLVQDRVVPYYSRADIETKDVLKGHELLWIDDPVEAFFLHVQGSGRVRLRDGSMVRVNFSDTNGLHYRPIGRVMIDRGLLPPGGANAPAIKAWLRANPQSAASVMHANPRFVFFREQANDSIEAGPPGTLTVPLTPQRSIATDARVIPLGSLVYLQTSHPQTGEPFARLTVSQDTGVAIVGPVRADVFWGNGEEAEKNAGLMSSRGKLWLLWPNDLELPRQRAAQ